MKKKTLFTILVMGTLTLSLAKVNPRFVINLSESMPMGIYKVTNIKNPKANDIVLFSLPQEVKELTRDSSWLSPTTPLLKRVRTVSQGTICSDGKTVELDGKLIGRVVLRDREGRPIPHLTGCRTAGEGELLVLGDNQERSFDSRYFGPISKTLVKGKAELILEF